MQVYLVYMVIHAWWNTLFWIQAQSEKAAGKVLKNESIHDYFLENWQFFLLLLLANISNILKYCRTLHTVFTSQLIIILFFFYFT